MARGVRILLVGCGELGSRHLQAVAVLPQVTEIEIVDPRGEALDRGRERVREVADRSASTAFRWLASLEEATPEGALCIVATQAHGRCQLVRQIVEQTGYRAFLLEKIVGQSVREIEHLDTVLAARGGRAWVNLKTRAYPIHQHIKAKLERGDPILFHSMGGNHGLANNGVHTADLFVFYDEAGSIEPAGIAVDPALHPSKRGSDLFDLSGTLQGRTAKGSHFVLSYASDHAQSEQIALTTQRYRVIVDHRQRWAVESDASTGWAWKPVPFEGDILVSAMTKTFVTDILTVGRCQLPSLQESLVAHRFILGALQPTFSRLLEQELEACPVT